MLALTKHVTRGDALRCANTYLFSRVGGTKVLFCRVNLQVSTSVGGKYHAKVFILEAFPPCPLHVRAWLLQSFTLGQG